MEIRLTLYLARASVASRRGAEQLIKQGRVKLNGQTCTNLAQRVIVDKDHVKVDGKHVKKPAPPVYLILNKPDGCVTTTKDPQGRKTVFDLLTRVKPMVEPVGRLDYNSEGLLLFTNDGDLAYVLMRPESKVPKTYRVKVNGRPNPQALESLRKGVELDGKTTLPAKVKRMRKSENYTWVRITIIEGKYRQVRRMFKTVGHPVVRLIRESYGPIELQGLAPARFRYLSQREIDSLRKAVK